MSTKIHATCDALGNPTGFYLTPGQACDLDGADILISDIDADILLADKGYDADARVLDRLEAAGLAPVIPPKSNRHVLGAYDKALDTARHLKQKSVNLSHLTLPEIKDFNALSDALCCGLNGFRSNRKLL